MERRKFIKEKDSNYHQYYAITKAYLKKLRKLLKGTKPRYPQILQVVIGQYEDGEVHISVFNRVPVKKKKPVVTTGKRGRKRLLKDADVKDIKRLYHNENMPNGKPYTYSTLAKLYRVSEATIANALKRR